MASPPAGILGVSTAVPRQQASADEVWTAVGAVRGRRMPRASAVEGARTRYFAEPLSSLAVARSQSQQTDAYLEHGRILARQVSCQALERSEVSVADIGLIVGISCTGVVLPSLDAELIPWLGLSPNVARLPITELGCGGGVSGLGLALDYTRAYPDRAVLLFAVELPSLTFQPDDHSVDNLVAAMVFGYELRDGGLRIVLSRELPQVVEAHLAGAVDAFLSAASISLSEIDLVAAHPGGPRIFDGIERALGLRRDALAVPRRVFDEYGNASSAGIFFVLEALQQSGARGRALAIAFGPGLSIELALLQFRG